MIQLIHSADWHLRDGQFGKTSRAKDFTDSVLRIIDIAKERGISHILCAGDILNSKKPSSNNVKDLLAINRKLLNNKIELFVITGNHDKCYPSWINVLEEEMEASSQCAIHDIDFKTAYLMANDGKEYSVYGVPDMAPEDFKEKSKTFPKADILLFHGLIKEFASFDAGDKALSIEDLPYDKYSAILLGDIHTHKYMTHKGCLIGYPGATELCSRSEAVDKFAGVITLHDTGAVTIESAPIPLNKPIIARDVKTDDEIKTLLDDIEKVKAQHPTLLIRKAAHYSDLYARIARIVNTSECIIRVSNIPSAGFKLMNLANREKVDPTDKKPEDFVSDYFSADTDIFSLAKMLCDPNAKASPLIEEFIDKRLYANKSTSNKRFG